MKVTIASFALLATLYLSPVSATDMPANLSFKGEYVRVSMFMDDRILQSRPLADACKLETLDWAKALEADERTKTSEPSEKLPAFGRRYDVSAIIGNQRYFSLTRMSATEIDTEYNAIDIDTVLWDTATNQRITIAPFFKETADDGPTLTALLAEVASGLTKEIGKDKTLAMAKTLKPSMAGIGPVSLAASTNPGKSSGLRFHYALPLAGRYALSHIAVFVSWTTFRRFLSLRGRAIFGGNRPEYKILRDQ